MTRPIRILELRSVWGTGGGPEKTILLGAAQADPQRFVVTVCYVRDDRDTVYRDRRPRVVARRSSTSRYVRRIPSTRLSSASCARSSSSVASTSSTRTTTRPTR